MDENPGKSLNLLSPGPARPESSDATSAEDEWERRQRRIKQAEQYRNLGNESFKRNFLESAIEYYTKAIECNPDNVEYHTNRALCYKKQGRWKEVASDVREALNIDEDSVKAHYYLGQALLHLDQPQEGLKKLLKAKTLSEHYHVPYIDEIEDELFKAKKLVWLNEDAKFVEEINSLKGYIQGAIERDKEAGTLSAEEATQRLSQHKRIFDTLERTRKPEIPSYMFCAISMCLMKDPVITPSGITYERELLKQHLQRNGEFEPVTREPCSMKNVYCNYALKEAIDLFLKENPWAYGE